jgi:hypothetical protein
MFRFGYVTITSEDLDVWKQFPNAKLTLVAPCARLLIRTG